MIKAILTAAAVAILTGCAAATPLLIAEAGGNQVVRIFLIEFIGNADCQALIHNTRFLK